MFDHTLGTCYEGLATMKEVFIIKLTYTLIYTAFAVLFCFWRF